MQFRTALDIPASLVQINHQSRVLLVGSCFSDQIGQLLEQHQFITCVNPWGTLYNPLSLEKLLSDVSLAKVYSRDDLIFDQDKYHSFQHHSSFSDTDFSKVLDQIHVANQQVRAFLSSCDVVFITLGTAWVYKYLKTGEYVSNCHKVASSAFSKELISYEQIVDSLMRIQNAIKMIRPTVHVFWTISPVRHIKDGLIENTKSKSLLHAALNQMLASEPQNAYFPAYEWMMDDLRDYRFYSEDLIHPNKQAIQYIWEKFQATYFSEQTQSLNKKIYALQRTLSHRPQSTDALEYQKWKLFCQTQKNQIEEVLQRPFITNFKLQNE